MRCWLAGILIAAFAVASSSFIFGEDKAEVAALLKGARSELPKIKDVDPRLQAWIRLAAAHARLGNKQTAAADFVECMRLTKAIPEPRERDSFLIWIAKEQAAADDYPAALKSFREIPADGFRDLCLINLVEVACERRDTMQALQLVKLSGTPEFRDSQLYQIAVSLAGKQDFKPALKVSEQIVDQRERQMARDAVGLAALDARDFPLAFELLVAPPGTHNEGWFLIKVCAAREAAGDLAGAQRDFKKAYAILGEEENGDVRWYAYALSRFGDIEEPLRKLRKKTSQEDRDAVLLDFVTGLAAAGKYERATALSGEIKDGTKRVESLHKIAQVQEKAGDKAGALRTLAIVQTIEDFGYADLLAIARQLHRLGERNRARFRVQQALDAARATPIGGGTDVIRLSEVALAQADLGNSAAALQTFRSAGEAALKYPDVAYQAQLIAEYVARPQAKLFGATEISKWIIESRDPFIRGMGRVAIAQGLLDRDAKRPK